MPRKKPAPDPIIEQRVQAILQIRLDGAETYDVRVFVSEKEAAGEQPWKLDADESPLSERQIQRYIEQADGINRQNCATASKHAMQRHRGRRNQLYARAVQAGDIRTALAVLADLARLEDLYPATRFKDESRDIDKLIKAELDRLATGREKEALGPLEEPEKPIGLNGANGSCGGNGALPH